MVGDDIFRKKPILLMVQKSGEKTTWDGYIYIYNLVNNGIFAPYQLVSVPDF